MRALPFAAHHTRSARGTLRAVSAPSPLDARRFFAGRWQGQGELAPHGPARLVVARQPVRLEGRGEWLTERVWRVHERFTLGSGFGFERDMWMEQVAPDRVHATADDIPLGAELELLPDGFRFRRFRSWLAYRGVRFRLGCASETRLAADGVLHARIRLDLWRIPVATLRLEIRVERG
jgi:hypothetical protein